MLKNLFYACITALLIVFQLSPAYARQDSDSGSETVTLQLRWYHQFQFAGYYAAKEKGYYRDAGLDVIIKEVDLNTDSIEEVVSGRAHYGICVSNIVIQRNNGMPVVVLAAIYQHSPLILLSRKDSGILSPQDLIGMRLMIRRPEDAQALAIFLNENVELKDIELVRHTFDYDDLIDKKVDAATASITSQPYYLKEHGVDYAYMQPRTYGIDFYGDCLFTSEMELKQHPERVKAFREASLKGWAYAMNNKEEIIQLIQNKYRANVSVERLRYEAEAMDDVIMPKLLEIGHMNPGRWQHIADTYARTGLLNKDYSLEGFLYDANSVTDNVQMYKAMKYGAVFVILISLITFILIIFNRRLKASVNRRTVELSSINAQLSKEIHQRRMLEQALKKYQGHLEDRVKTRTIDLEREIEERKKAEKEKEQTISKLQSALSEIKKLRKLLPICSICHKIRDDKGYWSLLEEYFHKYSDVEFSHSICPSCAREHYPELNIYGDDQGAGMSEFKCNHNINH